MGQAPSIEQWRDLCDAAIAFKALACWEWLADNDVFAVQNPETGEMGYCCVMGQLGQLFGLAVYLGAEGLASYDTLARAKTKSASEEAGYNQLCLMASFLDREALYKADRDIIRALGLKFRGRNAWPLFRSHLPGYFPWYLTAKRLRASIPQRDMTWEIDIYYASFPVKDDEGDRPVYPLVLLCVDRDSGFIFGTELMSPAEKPNVAIKFLGFLVKAGVMPSELAIAREDLLALPEPAASALGIHIHGEKRLKQIPKARKSLESGFTRF